MGCTLRRVATGAIAAALGLSTTTHGQETRPRLALERLDGRVSEVALEGVSIRDPRDREAWFVRPLDVPRVDLGQAGGAAKGGRTASIELADGDIVRGRIVGGEGETLTLELPGGVRLPIDILRIRRVQPEGFTTGEVVVFETPKEGDRLYRRVGDKVDPTDGTVQAFTANGVRFESLTIGTKEYRWADIATLFVEVLDELESGDEDGAASGCPVVVDMDDGSRLSGSLLGLDARGCSIRKAGTDLVLPWGIVHEVAVTDGAFAFLSERSPVREEERGTPFGDEFGMVWNHRVDRCVSGDLLRVGGKVFRRGIGAHAPTRIVWGLEGRFSSLRGRVAIDDSSLVNPANARGSVIFRVLLDGQVAWESPVVHGGDTSVQLPIIEFGAARELTLEADMAGDFSGDRANWLRMLLVR